jgi:hypothetical protein
MPHGKASILLSQKELGYFPYIKLKEGLQNLYASQKFLKRNSLFDDIII